MLCRRTCCCALLRIHLSTSAFFVAHPKLAYSRSQHHPPPRHHLSDSTSLSLKHRRCPTYGASVPCLAHQQDRWTLARPNGCKILHSHRAFSNVTRARRRSVCCRPNALVNHSRHHLPSAGAQTRPLYPSFPLPTCSSSARQDACLTLTFARAPWRASGRTARSGAAPRRAAVMLPIISACCPPHHISQLSPPTHIAVSTACGWRVERRVKRARFCTGRRCRQG
jgi:hypothetical protein